MPRLGAKIRSKETILLIVIYILKYRKERWLRKIVLVLLIVIALSIATVSPVFAGGDQLRGDKAEGPAYQAQEQDPPPFQP